MNQESTGAVRIGGYTADDVGNVKRFLDSLDGEVIRSFGQRPFDDILVWYVLSEGDWVPVPEREIRTRWVEITEAMLAEAEAMPNGPNKATAVRWVHRSRYTSGIKAVMDAAADALYVAPHRIPSPAAF
jgi:hypothetical protein